MPTVLSQVTVVPTVPQMSYVNDDKFKSFAGHLSQDLKVESVLRENKQNWVTCGTTQ